VVSDWRLELLISDGDDRRSIDRSDHNAEVGVAL